MSEGTEKLQKLAQEYIDTMFGEFQCDKCKHYIDGNTCKAFAKIPLEIVAGEHEHTRAYPGDNGIRFEAK